MHTDMKKSFFYSVFLTALLAVSASSFAQTTGGFDLSDGQASASPQQATPVEPVSLLEDLKSKPLAERRKLVVNELETIAGKLDTLIQKTTLATTRLGENGIDTVATFTALDTATATLTTTKTLIATLKTAANDPKNESVQALSVQGVSFKEAVIKAEGGLRTTRDQIITALATLKVALTTSITQ